MAGLFDSIVNDVIKESILTGREKVRNDRIKLRQKQLDFYQDNQHAEASYFAQYGFSKKQKLPYVSSGLTTRVINKRSLVYKEAPMRVLLDANGTPIEKDSFNQFTSDHPEFQRILKKAERHHELLNNCLLRWTWSEDAGFLWYVETEYDPIFSSDNEIYPIGYKIPLPPQVNGKKIVDPMWLCISDEEYFYVNKAGVKSFDPQYKDGKNPYNIMPIVDYSDPDIDSYWTTGSKSLVEVNQNLNLALFAALHGIRFQSFSQLWAKIRDAEKLPKNSDGVPELTVGHDKAVQLGANDELGVLNFQPALTETMEFIERWLNMELSNYGMKASFKEQGNPQSGFALVVSNQELLEARQDKLDHYRPIETRNMKILSAMSDAHKLPYKIPEGASLQTKFVKPEFPKSQDEIGTQREQDFKWNLSTPVDWLMERFPGMTEDEALEKLRKNKKVNQELGLKSVGRFNTVGQAAIQRSSASGDDDTGDDE